MTVASAAGVILAGGRSSRMGGGDKPLLDLGGRPILTHALARLAPQLGILAINANGDPARFAQFGLAVLRDTTADFPGPLAGVEAAMLWGAGIGADVVVTASGDTPFMPGDLVARLLAAPEGKVAIAESRGRLHPTFAAWPVRLMGDLGATLARGQRKVLAFLESQGYQAVSFDDEPLGGHMIDPFFNINEPADLEMARTWLASS